MMMSNESKIAGPRIFTRMAILAVPAIFGLLVMPVQAEAQTPLPEITVQPPTPRSTDRIGGDGKGGGDAKGKDNNSFERLNQQLKREVDESNPIGNNPPLDARSPDTKTGVVNIPGVQQQYGKNFGNSVIPYRPAAPVYTSPLGHR
jgi:hypothetical protein